MFIENMDEIRSGLTAEGVLAFIAYAKSKPEQNGKELRDYCPVHEGDSQRSFSFNIDKRVGHCHSCGFKGDLIELYRAYIKKNGRDIDFQEATTTLADHFGIPVKYKIQENSYGSNSTSPKEIWNRSSTTGSHPYFKTKKVESCDGLKYGKDLKQNHSIIVPFYNIHKIGNELRLELQTIQFINEWGKFFLTGFPAKNGFFPIGQIKDGDTIWLAEGLATSLTIWAALGRNSTVISFGSAGNMTRVIDSLKENYPHIKLIVCLDKNAAAENQAKKINPKYKCRFRQPSFDAFPNQNNEELADFNDLVSRCGQSLEVVKAQLEKEFDISSITISEFSKEEHMNKIEEQNDQSLRIPIVPISDRIKSHKATLEKYRGKKYLGLRVKTITEFNENMLGLRKLILLAAAPNVGKTALTIQLAKEVLLTEPNACLVYLSLEMDAEEIFTRMNLYHSGLNFDTYVLGNQHIVDKNERQVFFIEDELRKINGAEKTIEAIGNRLQIVDASSFNHLNADTIIEYVERLKIETGCNRAIVVIDYLQVWPTPQNMRFTSDNEADKWRIGEIKKIRDALNTSNQDPVIVISEARKPSSKDEEWGGDLSDVMGSARGTYTPDAVLLLSQLSSSQLNKLWEDKEFPDPKYTEKGNELEDKKDPKNIKSFLAHNGIALCNLKMPKGRDGMKKFNILLAFHFNKNKFTSIDWDYLLGLAMENKKKDQFHSSNVKEYDENGNEIICKL